MSNQNKIEKKTFRVIDGNEAATNIAYRTNEICAIYPITPASPMGELADLWASQEKKTIFGTVPDVIEMQSEAGAVAALHGAIQTGTLATTFTASQGLLLMIPNMYKISGELTPTVFHIAARAIASQSMSIFGDHSDVMATRSTGFALLCSANVQEAHDMALIAQAASLKSRIPFLHFFDGFRTSHEVSKIETLSDENIRAIIDEEDIQAHRNRRLNPEKPFIRGIISDPDTFFQGRESVNPFYQALPDIVNETMKRFHNITSRKYQLIDYVGHQKAERIIIVMGSGVETVQETVQYLQKENEKVGLLKIRLFRPLSKKHLLHILPTTCRSIAVLDRTKEPGASGEPLYQEITTLLSEAFTEGSLSSLPKIIGGRFGLSGKEFTPAMVKAIFDELKKENPKNHFTIGITDDLTFSHLEYDQNFETESDEVTRALFYGLGSDGTVSANKNTTKIIGEETHFYAQAYFVYDSKKSRARTTSHLRFGPNKIHSAYLIRSANFIGCHQFHFINKINLLARAAKGATFLLNSPHAAHQVWNHLPRPVQQAIIDKQIKFYVIDAYRVARKTDMGSRINTIMQACFFALSKILPLDKAIQKIKDSIKETYSLKGKTIVDKNFQAVDQALENLFEVSIPDSATSNQQISSSITEDTPSSAHDFIEKVLSNQGDTLPISAIPNDGTHPSGTTRFEKNNTALALPIWNPNICIQCGRCSIVCPHSIIRAKQAKKKELNNAPACFKSATLRGKSNTEKVFILQTYSEYCTACKLCEEACPVKGKAIQIHPKEKQSEEEEKQNISFFETLPYREKSSEKIHSVQDVQFLQPLFEFCCACAGCGETPYVKLLTQLFGDRTFIANACGCSLVYGSNLPTNPWRKDNKGKGVTYSGSLFEDNAEFGYGFRLSEDFLYAYAVNLLKELSNEIGEDLADRIIHSREKNINEQRNLVLLLKDRLKSNSHCKAKELITIADSLIQHSVWAVGGDGWAYDIGYGGLDHVLASNRNINILVLDTEVYSNTGGQSSKATPRGAVVKFATHGKPSSKKDLGMMAMNYENAYVASIALGANPAQTIKAMQEAERYPGPSLIIAYSHCLAHGIDMQKGMQQQALAVKSGYWLLYRHNPALIKEGKNPLQLDSPPPSIPVKEYMMNENRFKALYHTNLKEAEYLMMLAQEDVDRRWRQYAYLAKQRNS